MALEIGLSVFDFWEMTLGEIIDTVDAYKRRKKTELKERAYMDYKLSICIANSVSCLFSNDNEPKSLLEMYPELYEEENKEFEEIKIQNEIEIQKQNMIAFANFHNSNMKGG